MMDKLDQYRVFAQVAHMRNFTKAALALDMPKASVSVAIQELEKQMGVRLLSRTTRQVHVTDEGAQLLARVTALLNEVEAMDHLFAPQTAAIKGRLVVDVPSRIARRVMAPALPQWLRLHPQLELVLGSSDRAVDLVREGVDCVLRIGALSDSSLVVRPVGTIAQINCASPRYLAHYGTPTAPEDLLHGHWTVGYTSARNGKRTPWEVVRPDGQEQQFEPASQVTVNNVESYIACGLAGAGLFQIPRYDVQHLLDAGELVEVMSEARPPDMAVSVLYPHRRQRTPRLLAFLDWFEPLLKAHLR